MVSSHIHHPFNSSNSHIAMTILITCYHQKFEQLKSSLECTIHSHKWPIDLLLILPLVQEEECTYTCLPTLYKHDSKSHSLCHFGKCFDLVGKISMVFCPRSSILVLANKHGLR